MSNFTLQVKNVTLFIQHTPLVLFPLKAERNG